MSATGHKPPYIEAIAEPELWRGVFVLAVDILRRVLEREMPVMMRERAKFPERKIEPLDQRRKRQVLEASQAMKDYKHTQQAVRERMAALRDERLAREAQENAQEKA